MQIHSQSSVRYEYNERKDILFPVDRQFHTAIEHTLCPKCDARAGALCKGLGPLDVHYERQIASL